MTSHRFLRWRPAAILDLIWIILDYPWSAIVGLSLVLNFGLDRIYSFGDIANFIFRRFGLKFLCRATLAGEDWEHISPNDVTHRTNPKRHLTRKHVVWAIKRENRFSGSTFARDRQRKGQEKTVKKVTFYSHRKSMPIWAEAPTVPSKTKIGMMGSLQCYFSFEIHVSIMGAPAACCRLSIFCSLSKLELVKGDWCRNRDKILYFWPLSKFKVRWAKCLEWVRHRTKHLVYFWRVFCEVTVYVSKNPIQSNPRGPALTYLMWPAARHSCSERAILDRNDTSKTKQAFLLIIYI